MTLVLTYHAVEPGPAPICLTPELFSEHLGVIRASGAHVLTAGEVAAAVRSGSLPERAVAITFDDGYASVAEQAAPLMREQGFRGTVFAVAGHLGGTSDWPTQASWAPQLRLADEVALASLAAEGWEIGSHGVHHAPLNRAREETARLEVAESRRRLEEALGVPVSTFAWPYGAPPSDAAATVVADTYDAAYAAGPAVVRSSSDPYALPRSDIHYLRSPRRLRRALEREPHAYLALRRAAGSIRRAIRPDYRA